MAHSTHSNITQKGLALAFWLNAGFCLVEIAGGIFTHSTAIITDAKHDFGDALAIGAAILIERIASSARTKSFSYGYRRLSLLSAILLSVMLLVGATVMIWKSGIAFSEPKLVNSAGMLCLSVLGTAVNLFAFLRIRNGHGSHQHGLHPHGDHHDPKHNYNSRAIMLHLLEDVLGWIAVLLGAIMIYFTGWSWIDPLLAMVIGVYVLYNAVKNLSATMAVMLQALPKGLEVEQLEQDLRSIEGVNDIHDMHIWSLDGSYTVGTFHLVTSGMHSSSQLMDKACAIFKKHKIDHPAVQWEDAQYNCSLVNC